MGPIPAVRTGSGLWSVPNVVAPVQPQVLPPRGKRKVETSRVSLLGDKCWAGSLLVWFSASWMSLVVEAIQAKNVAALTHQDTVVPYASQLPTSIGFKLRRWHADRSGQTPILHGSTNVTWVTLCPERYVHLFHTLYAGLLDDVYFHKVVTAWERAAATRVQVSLLLPSWEPAEGWLHSVRASRHLWPLQMSNTGTLSKVSAKHCVAKERKRLGTRHVWETLDLNWTAIKECLFTRGPTGRNRQELYNALFGRARQGSAMRRCSQTSIRDTHHFHQGCGRTPDFFCLDGSEAAPRSVYMGCSQNFGKSSGALLGQFPPASMAQIYIDQGTEMAKLRRLHLIIVDLLHPRRSALRAFRYEHREMCRARPRKGSNTTPMVLVEGEEWRCRYAYGYALDGSEIPVYLVMPYRTEFGSFYLLDCATGQYFDLRDTLSIEPIGIEHFYKSFGLQLDRDNKRDLIGASTIAFGLDVQNKSQQES